jgi:type I restriction enzyme M protein
MVDRLSKLVAIFEDERLDFSKNRSGGDDLLGDAYEYLMRYFATESGKSKCQFYTPAEVSKVIARVIGTDNAPSQDVTIYDPTCGSGSLLLKGADESPQGLSIYGQEKDNATAAMAKMNMILHENPTAEIWQDNTLSSPHWRDDDHTLKRFDFVVANPPFSTKSWKTGFDPEHDIYQRFTDGIPPNKNGDYAFVLHILASMKSTGKGAVVMPHGVLFRGNAEGEIRRNLITRGYIKGIISLPPNLFYGTGIPACLLILDKEHAGTRTGIFMIDASKGFIKDGNKNRLRHQDIRKIVDVFNSQLEVPKYSRLVPLSEIVANDYNLNIPRYIDSSEPEVIQDIEAHLKGGIPNRDIDALDAYWQAFPSLKDQLFEPIPGRPNYSQFKVETSQLRQVVQENAEYQAFQQRVRSVFDGWWDRLLTPFSVMDCGVSPQVFINALGNTVLEEFSDLPLIDKYDIYQHLMDYWTQTMQDDAYMIANDGWVANADLLPEEIIIQHYFKEEKDAIDQLVGEKEAILAQKTELEEENSGEEGLLEEVKTDSGNITRANINRRIREIASDPEFSDELVVLNKYLALLDQETQFNRQIRQAQMELDSKVKAKYSTFVDSEVSDLVIDDKWCESIRLSIMGVVDMNIRELLLILRDLSYRYDVNLLMITKVSELSILQVNEHLLKMGFYE